MGDFFLDKDVAKIGDSVSIKGNCVDSGAVFQSDNPSVAVIDPYTGTGIQAV